MHAVARYTDYDDFAWFYNQYWGTRCCEQIFPIVEQMVLSAIPPRAHILDLCCGTGQVARELVDRGYKVTGIDGSAEMIRYARMNAPGARFIVADARWFTLPEQYHAVICTSDSLNHILNLSELRSVFDNVYQVLDGGGLFFFDMNREEAYKMRDGTTAGVVHPDDVFFIRAEYNQPEALAKFEITTFRKAMQWKRADLTLYQKCYPDNVIKRTLKEAGFRSIRTFDMEHGLSCCVRFPATVFLSKKPKRHRSALSVSRPGALVAMYPCM